MARLPVRRIVLDASAWGERDHVWAALLPALGAPDWHGPSLDALFDSLVADLNRLKPPYRIIVVGAPATLLPYIARVRTVFVDARAQYGVAADLEIA